MRKRQRHYLCPSAKRTSPLKRKNVQFAELLSQSWCDILFANRNKEYGAYQLRRKAGLRYRRAVTMVVALIAISLSIPLIMKGLFYLQLIDAAKDMNEERILDRLKPLEEHRLVEMAMGRRPRRPTSSKALVGSVEIVDVPQNQPNTALDFGPDMVETGEGVAVNVEPSPPLLKDTLAPIQKDPIIPVKVVEEMPQFPGGPSRLMQWLDEHIAYPQQLINKKIEGTVTVVFIVKHDGRIDDIRLTQKLHPELDKAVATAVQRMPQWTPGRRSGRATDVQVTIPAEFHAR